VNQGHIQGDSVVSSYLHHQLSVQERSDFEAHLVDCEECRDRVLLAEMFHVRNGLVRQTPTQEKPEEPKVDIVYRCIPHPPRPKPLPTRARFVAGLRPWQIWVILIAAAMLLVLIPTSYFVLTGQ